MKVAGSVLGAVALTGAASPGQVDSDPGGPSSSEITQALDLAQLRAADATAQAAVVYELQATEEQAAADAQRTAQRRRNAADAARAKAAAAKTAAAQAARQRAAAQAASPAARAVPTAPSASATPTGSSTAGGSIATVLSFLRAQLGKPYVLGASGPSAYDCSGLVQAAFRTIGINLPRVSQSQSTAGTPVSLSNLQPGDILYWGSAGSAYHVAVYVGGGNFIGAQNPSSGVVEKPLSYSPPTGAVRVR